LFPKLLKGQGRSPRLLVPDKLRGYSASKRKTLPSAVHDTNPYAANRAELSHQPTRERERKMRRFKSPGQAQRFLAVHAVVASLFRLGRHLTKAMHYRSLRSAAFRRYREVTCVH
jgi:putative transposase